MESPPRFILVEPLESRQLRAAVEPTAAEQYAVELINRARANPTAEAALYNGYADGRGDTYNGDLNEGLPAGRITTAAKQPLAINTAITAAARGHAAWMVANSTFSHTGANGTNAGQRIASAGYTDATSWGENIAINWSSGTLDPVSTVNDQQRSLFTDQTISDRGHRTNMLEATRNEIGVGLAAGPYNYPGYGVINSYAQSAETATDGRVFLTGVAYSDVVAADDFYTPGEGLGGIAVTATNVASGQSYATTTWASGGYSLPVPDGTYDVSAVGNGVTNNAVYYNGVTVAGQNVEQDFVTGATGDVAAGAAAFAKIVGRTLVVTGTAASDTIGVTDRRGVYTAAVGSQVQKFDATDIDTVAVLAGDGDDLVVVGTGVLRSYVEGGAGRDTLIGGLGQDTLYGGSGNDRLEGNAAEDVLVGEAGNDLIYGGLGNDRVYGGSGNDTVDAGAGNDHVWGGDGDDLLAGGRGHDFLYGELGADTLNGGVHTDYGDDDPLDTRVSVEVLNGATSLA